eukprot:5708565-Pyramimonas_sp.AAC.2
MHCGSILHRIAHQGRVDAGYVRAIQLTTRALTPKCIQRTPADAQQPRSVLLHYAPSYILVLHLRGGVSRITRPWPKK